MIFGKSKCSPWKFLFSNSMKFHSKVTKNLCLRKPKGQPSITICLVYSYNHRRNCVWMIISDLSARWRIILMKCQCKCAPLHKWNGKTKRLLRVSISQNTKKNRKTLDKSYLKNCAHNITLIQCEFVVVVVGLFVPRFFFFSF